MEENKNNNVESVVEQTKTAEPSVEEYRFDPQTGEPLNKNEEKACDCAPEIEESYDENEPEWESTPVTLQPVNPGKKAFLKPALGIVGAVAVIVAFNLLTNLIVAWRTAGSSPILASLYQLTECMKPVRNTALGLAESLTLEKDVLLPVAKLKNTQVNLEVSGKVDGNTFSADIVAKCKPDDQKSLADVEVAVMDMNSSASLYTDKNSAIVSADMLGDKAIEIPLKDFGKKFNQSAIQKLVGDEVVVPDDFSIDTAKASKFTENIIKELNKKCGKKFSKIIKNSIQYRSAGEKIELVIDGKTKSYRLKEMVVTPQACAEVINLLADFIEESEELQDLLAEYEQFRVEPQEAIEESVHELRRTADYLNEVDSSDVLIIQYVVEQDMIRYVGYGDPDSDDQITVSFLGKKDMFDRIEITVPQYGDEMTIIREREKDGRELSDVIVFRQSGRMERVFEHRYNTKTGEFDLELMSGEALDVSGTIKKNSRSGMDLTVDSVVVDNELLNIEGSLSLTKLRGRIEKPEDTVNLFDMSEVELQGFLQNSPALRHLG